MAYPWQVYFQDPASPVMDGIIRFHDDVMHAIVAIALFVIYILVYIIFNFHYQANPQPSKVSHHTLLEIVWTVTPAALLGFIAVPSFALLYSTEEVIQPSLTVKVIGHQWYWSYEYSETVAPEEFVNLEFDSYMVPTSELVEGRPRLLDVDNRMVVPSNTPIRVLITSEDVLHAFAVPSLGLKLDACPGRLNQILMFSNRNGLFFGQCSEICGINHGFMPIAVNAISSVRFVGWLVGVLKINPSDSNECLI